MLKAFRWAGLLAGVAGLCFSFSGVIGVLTRPQSSLAGTDWSGMGHSASFLDSSTGFYDGEPFSYEEKAGAAKCETADGDHVDFVMMSGGRLFCVTDLSLMLRS